MIKLISILMLLVCVVSCQNIPKTEKTEEVSETLLENAAEIVLESVGLPADVEIDLKNQKKAEVSEK